MIKKLQALRAKKGFTLVELIVVIAIIGVLAAILVPTMMGMVTKSRVTSVDQTAATIRDQVSTWMMNLDTEGGRVAAEATINIDVNASAGGSETSGGAAGATVSVDYGDATFNRANGNAADTMLEEQIADAYNFGTKEAHAIVYVVDRKVIGTIYYEGAETSETLPTAEQFPGGEFAWGGSQDGIMADGTTVGTSPKLLSPEEAGTSGT